MLTNISTTGIRLYAQVTLDTEAEENILQNNPDCKLFLKS